MLHSNVSLTGNRICYKKWWECCQSVENRYLPESGTKKDNPECRLTLQHTQILDSVWFIRDINLQRCEAGLIMSIYLLLKSMVLWIFTLCTMLRLLGRVTWKLFSWMLFEIYGQSFPTQGLGGFIVTTVIKYVCAYFHVARWQVTIQNRMHP